RDAVLAVAARHRAPGAGECLGTDEGLALVAAADHREGDAALARRRHAIGRDLREGAEQRVEHAPADDRARGAGGGWSRVEDRAQWRHGADRPDEALEIRNVL